MKKNSWLESCIERGKHGVHAEVANLTPEIAQALLDRNPDNRNIRQEKVAQIASDIRAGRFMLNGESLVVSDEGLTNDGQHRCVGVVITGISIETVFVFGVSRESRVTLDSGAARTAADYVGMEGIPYAKGSATLSKLLLAYERNGGRAFTGAAKISRLEILEKIRETPAITSSAAFAAVEHKHVKSWAPSSVISVCHFLLTDKDPVQGDFYMRQITRGLNLASDDPAYAVRARLLNIDVKGDKEKKTQVILRGWNAFRKGEKRSIIKLMPGSDFPTLL
jgi:hypothetical protein